MRVEKMESPLRMLIAGVLVLTTASLHHSVVHGRPNADASTASTTVVPSSVSTTAESYGTTMSSMEESDIGDDDTLPTTTTIATASTTSAGGPVARSIIAEGSSIRRCPHGDDDSLNRCLRQILVELKPKFSSGVPELNIPPMDPLKIANVAFSHGSGPVKVIASFSNVDVRGLSSYNKSDFSVDTKLHVLDFDLGIAQMQITGNYQLAGNLFFFPIGGSGSFWLNLGGITAKGQGKLGAVTKNGHKNIVVRKIDIDLDISTIKLHLTNLFNGDPLLGNVINTFLNENAKDIFDEVRPQIGNQVAEMVSVLANRALSNLPADQLLNLPEEDQAEDDGADDDEEA